MIFTEQERTRIQSELDAAYEQALKDYEALVADNSPLLLWVKNPERITPFVVLPYVRVIKRNTAGTRKLARR